MVNGMLVTPRQTPINTECVGRFVAASALTVIRPVHMHQVSTLAACSWHSGNTTSRQQRHCRFRLVTIRQAHGMPPASVPNRLYQYVRRHAARSLPLPTLYQPPPPPNTRCLSHNTRNTSLQLYYNGETFEHQRHPTSPSPAHAYVSAQIRIP